MVAYQIFSPARNGYFAGWQHMASGMQVPVFEANPLDGHFFEDKDEATTGLNHIKLGLCKVVAFSIKEVPL